MKPKDLLHELEQGERIAEDLKRFLTLHKKANIQATMASNSTSYATTMAMPVWQEGDPYGRY